MTIEFDQTSHDKTRLNVSKLEVGDTFVHTSRGQHHSGLCGIRSLTVERVLKTEVVCVSPKNAEFRFKRRFHEDGCYRSDDPAVQTIRDSIRTSREANEIVNRMRGLKKDMLDDEFKAAALAFFKRLDAKVEEGNG